MTDEREGIPHTWRMLGAVGLSSMMAATGIFLLGGADSSASAPMQPGGVLGRSVAPAHPSTTLKIARVTTSLTQTSGNGATTHAASCSHHYVVRAGDSWSLIASEAGMSLDALLELNHSTVNTGLQPGQSLCIPVGVSVVTSTAPSTTLGPKPAPATTVQQTPKWVPPATAVPARPVYTPVARSGSS
jgi:LysM repeat protein